LLLYIATCLSEGGRKGEERGEKGHLERGRGGEGSKTVEKSSSCDPRQTNHFLTQVHQQEFFAANPGEREGAFQRKKKKRKKERRQGTCANTSELLIVTLRVFL